MNRAGGGDPWDVLFDDDSDRSFEDPEDHEIIVKAHKKKDVKLNNSFTGPYPQDPTDFNHNDKGANAQFVYYNKFVAEDQAKAEAEAAELESKNSVSRS